MESTDNFWCASLDEYKHRPGLQLLDRLLDSEDWQRCQAGVERERGVAPLIQLDLARGDHLGLTGHAQVKEAAHAAIDRGLAGADGECARLRDLEQALADFLQQRDCTLFASIDSATYSLFNIILAENDFVLIDAGASLRLQRGVRGASRLVTPYHHLDNGSLQRELRRIRLYRPHASVLVVTQSLFPFDSDTPDLPAVQTLAKRFGATLLVDVGYDLGSLGPQGGGLLAQQGMLGAVDLVLGDLRHCFATPGGFVAGSHPCLAPVLRLNASTFDYPRYLLPSQVAVAATALELIVGGEGERRRSELSESAKLMREMLRDGGFAVTGVTSAYLPIPLGSLCRTRLVARSLAADGVRVECVEPPLVEKAGCCLLPQLSAGHGLGVICDLFDALNAAVRTVDRHLDSCVETWRRGAEQSVGMAGCHAPLPCLLDLHGG